MARLALRGLAIPLLATACGDDPVEPVDPPVPGPGNLPPPSVVVDADLDPVVSELPGLGGDDPRPRPVAAVEDESGHRAAFVENEIWLAPEDDAALQAFLARWDGEVVASFDPEAYDLDGMPAQHLVRVEAPQADLGALARDLREIDPNSRGEHRVSSEAGAGLLAAAAGEAAAGRAVGVNWVGSGAAVFRGDSTTEASKGPTDPAYSPNAFAWPTHEVGGTQDIGVVGAWRALDFAGRLSDPNVPLAVLDMGFAPDRDWASGWAAIGNAPLVDPIGTRNALWCSGGSDCPWHGTDVVSSAMALPDNGYGAAGPAGPVAKPIAVYTLYDMFTSMTAIAEAFLLGARIANMSYSTPVPAGLGFSVRPFEATTALYRSNGMLLFASAGNEGIDVDAEDCFIVCWEETWHTPCENAGVICVGGLAWDSRSRDSGSNYGDEEVDIFAPYTLFAGPNPDHPDDAARVIHGTSYAAPFTAGVAALIWAADPGLSADEVEDLLLRTAHDSPDDDVARYVNAYGAVTAALGSVPPSLEILSPADGSDQPVGQPILVRASTEAFEAGTDCCDVEWESDGDGALGTGTSIRHTFSSLGTRTLSATATDGDGLVATETVEIDVVNSPPSPRFTRPLDGDEVYHSVAYTLRGYAFDPNEPGGRVECEWLYWSSTVAGDSLDRTGCEITATFASSGPRTLTLVAFDSDGGRTEASVDIEAVEPPENLPPTVTVTRPEDGASVRPDTVLTLDGTASDPEGDSPLDHAWFVRWPYDMETGEYTYEELIGVGRTVEWSPEDTTDFPCESGADMRLELRSTDPGGAVGSDYVVVRVSYIC